METKAVRVSLINPKRLADIGHKTDSFNDTITKVIDIMKNIRKSRIWLKLIKNLITVKEFIFLL